MRRPTRCIDESSRQDGYILLEIVCVLAIVGLLAAIILPAIPRATSRARLEGYAVATAAVLKADRVAALRQRVRVETIVNAEARTIRSGSGGRSWDEPQGLGILAGPLHRDALAGWLASAPD